MIEQAPLPGMPEPPPPEERAPDPTMDVTGDVEVRSSFVVNLLDLVDAHQEEWLQAVEEWSRYGVEEVASQFVYNALENGLMIDTFDAPGLRWTDTDSIDADNYRIRPEQVKKLYAYVVEKGLWRPDEDGL